MAGRLPMNLLERLLYRDGLMLIIDKPGGWVVYGAGAGGKNLEPLLTTLRFGLPRSPALVHRLDRGTSGCLILGRHPKATRRLNRLFSEHRIEKRYWAMVHGKPPNDQGIIDEPLREVEKSRTGPTMVVDPGGQPAITRYRLLDRVDRVSWLELMPITGRTHQLRVHCAYLGCSIIGDFRYGRDSGIPLHLHARQIIVPLHPNRPAIDVTAPPPGHLREWLTRMPNHREFLDDTP
ncbi:MAG: RNA pseudouridine synthase [Magnetococcales bacterium]|nr:RNA pseudouridine synthase [Magnetococcales bacterium]